MRRLHKYTHAELVNETRNYFKSIGYLVKHAVCDCRYVVNNHNVIPDLVVSIPDDGITDIPVECGTIGYRFVDKQESYIDKFGMYYHCTFHGKIYQHTLSGKILFANIEKPETWEEHVIHVMER